MTMAVFSKGLIENIAAHNITENQEKFETVVVVSPSSWTCHLCDRITVEACGL
jgi:hypothetical protein